MHHSPTQSEEDHSAPLKLQIVKFSNGGTAKSLHLGKNDLYLHLDQLTASRVCNPEFKRSLPAVRRNQGVLAIDDSCGRSREPAEDHARCQRYPQNIQKRFYGYEGVRGYADRNNVSISDSCEGIDAKKESAIERLRDKASRIRLQCIRAAEQESNCEDRVYNDVSSSDEAEEP